MYKMPETTKPVMTPIASLLMKDKNGLFILLRSSAVFFIANAPFLLSGALNCTSVYAIIIFYGCVLVKCFFVIFCFVVILHSIIESIELHQSTNNQLNSQTNFSPLLHLKLCDSFRRLRRCFMLLYPDPQ